MKPTQPHHPELSEPLKKAMGHQSPANVCRECKHFVPTDCSGNTDALRSHCTLNRVTIVDTNADDVCEFFRYSGVGGT